MTHTYAELEVSRATYEEIAQKLRAAGYHHAFHGTGRDTPTIEMHGIGLILEGNAMAEAKITDAALTDDMEIEIDIQLLQDRMSPKVEALTFDKDGDSQRITGLKASGSWTVKRAYRCRFTIGELRRLARSITKGDTDSHGHS